MVRTSAYLRTYDKVANSESNLEVELLNKNTYSHYPVSSFSLI